MLISAQTGAQYLIITHDDYYQTIQPLAEWKQQKGLKSKIVRLSEIGSDSIPIRNYIRNAYNTWEVKPEYVLLVGNDNQIPQVRIIHPLGDVYTDNYYTNVTGDFYNEIIPGRFWVYDTSHVKTLVAKVIMYEKYPSQDDTLWYKCGVTIVNEDEDTCPADSVYWSDSRYAHQLMQQAGFYHIDSLAQSFGDDSMDVITAFNQGRGYIMYRGIGFFVWDWPFMGLWESLLYNGWKTPIIISATCATVEGIGYTWMFLGTPEQPRGSVGFFGTTTALYHAAEFRSALARGTLSGIFNDKQCTMGIAAEYGRRFYTSIFNDSLEYYSWTCLGDPDMRLWTAVPRFISVIHDTILWVDNRPDTLLIQVNAGPMRIDSALVCILSSQDTTQHQSGYTDAQGSIVFIDTFTIPGDSVYLTVTGRNLRPYQTRIAVHHAGGPHVLLRNFCLNDTVVGNGDTIANPGEDIDIPIWLMNWGDSSAYGVSAVLSLLTPDSFVTLYDTLKVFGMIPGLDSAYSSDNGYNIVIAPNCPDTHVIDLVLTIEDSAHTGWNSELHIQVHAPILEYVSYIFPGTNKYAPLDDTSALILSIVNTGTYQAESLSGKLSCENTHITLIDSLAEFGTLLPSAIATNGSNPFLLMASPQLLPGTEIPIICELVSGVYIDTIEFTIYAGQRDYYIWDPDPNHSSGPVIHGALVSLQYNGDYSTTALPADDFLSVYKSLFVCLGVYPARHVVTDSSWEGPAILQYHQNYNGKVYIEGGDVWYADPHYNHGYFFYPLFEIMPTSNSVGLLPSVTGVDNTFTQTMTFTYLGENNSLDRIEAQGMGSCIFRKTSTSLGLGVAAYNRTVGLSFELGGLQDSVLPSTRVTLLDSIMTYFGIPPTGISERVTPDLDGKIFFDISPNPCRGNLHIAYRVGRIAQEVTIQIYDISGRCVKSFNLCNQMQSVLSLYWNGTDDLGRTVAQGIYIIQLIVDEHTLTKKIVLLR